MAHALVVVEVGQVRNGKSDIIVKVLDSISSDGSAATYRHVDTGYVNVEPKVKN